MTDADFYTSLNNGTHYIQNQFKTNINLTFPIAINSTLRKGYYDAYYGYYYNLDMPHYFGGIICAYFVGVMLIEMCIRDRLNTTVPAHGIAFYRLRRSS